MGVARFLRQARRRAGLSQRALGREANVPQSTIARIENGSIDPRASTLNRLLRACGHELETLPVLGEGVDRTMIWRRLRLSPGDRIRHTVAAVKAVEPIRRARNTVG